MLVVSRVREIVNFNILFGLEARPHGAANGPSFSLTGSYPTFLWAVKYLIYFMLIIFKSKRILLISKNSLGMGYKGGVDDIMDELLGFHAWCTVGLCDFTGGRFQFPTKSHSPRTREISNSLCKPGVFKFKETTWTKLHRLSLGVVQWILTQTIGKYFISAPLCSKLKPNHQIFLAHFLTLTPIGQTRHILWI